MREVATSVADVLSSLDALGIKRQRMTVDSRLVVAGDVFVAIPGARVDGRDFAVAAQARGAAAVLWDTAGLRVADTTEITIPVIVVENLSTLLGQIADAFYGQPSSRVKVFGITGTNGKTSIANWLAQAYSLLGQNCGAVGTLGVSLGDQSWPTNNTTPEAASVHTILRDLHEAGAVSVAMEVSSHALELARVSGVRFATVIFTNLTQDHLDFHGTMEAYGAAKLKLFTDYPVVNRVVNVDDAFGETIVARKLPNTITYGLERGDVRGEVLTTSSGGMTLRLHFAGSTVRVDTALIGRFNASNLMAVAATLLADHVSLETVANVLEKLKAAPGRMQRVFVQDENALPNVYVDYAHTPDALAKALDTVRETQPNSLTVVFGCGGDRDRRKRPLMGQIAAQRADRVYVTSDNPRNESPESIITEIVSGMSAHKAKLEIVVQRRDAIHAAIHAAQTSDAVLIAGKGHELYQEICGERFPFSDELEAQGALQSYRILKTVAPRSSGNTQGASHVGK
ncbi:MAG TPA: UDP-N-acetylmuramoyl-L-alanyl-D-glutamate--2,6-diaminopimelate ligase [Casimicrobium sp.]|nr:UDP-N-acetylmuramoyl-L-alanyl-D-glutamate--2,6-diaminopimelate ligase [Casimicrobium sp.]